MMALTQNIKTETPFKSYPSVNLYINIIKCMKQNLQKSTPPHIKTSACGGTTNPLFVRDKCVTPKGKAT